MRKSAIYLMKYHFIHWRMLKTILMKKLRMNSGELELRCKYLLHYIVKSFVCTIFLRCCNFVWDIKLDSKPFEEIVQGHIYISRSYSFYSVLVGRADTLNNSYPGFDKIGGKFQDHFVLPVDPEHLFQRYLIRKNHYYYVFCPN